MRVLLMMMVKLMVAVVLPRLDLIHSRGAVNGLKELLHHPSLPWR